MAAAVITVTAVAGSREYKDGNRRVRFFDITTDTGDYAAAGFTKTAADFGMKHLDFVEVESLATCGTAGATALGIGITHPSQTSVTFQVYESAATGLPFLEKTAEAYPANVTFRVRVTGQ